MQSAPNWRALHISSAESEFVTIMVVHSSATLLVHVLELESVGLVGLVGLETGHWWETVHALEELAWRASEAAYPVWETPFAPIYV